MSVVLAYGAPALGHLLPLGALLGELAARGHQVHLRTLAAGVDHGTRIGLRTAAVDPRIEDIQSRDWTARTVFGGDPGRQLLGRPLRRRRRHHPVDGVLPVHPVPAVPRAGAGRSRYAPAARVAAGFAATGGVARGADLIEQRVLGLPGATPV